jgi:hypothetical protein
VFIVRLSVENRARENLTAAALPVNGTRSASSLSEFPQDVNQLVHGLSENVHVAFRFRAFRDLIQLSVDLAEVPKDRLKVSGHLVILRAVSDRPTEPGTETIRRRASVGLARPLGTQPRYSAKCSRRTWTLYARSTRTGGAATSARHTGN